MKISKNARRHLDTARLLMESVEESLKKYPGVRYPYLLRREDSVESVHRRLVQIRQEIMAVSREFESAYETRRKLKSDIAKEFEKYITSL